MRDLKKKTEAEKGRKNPRVTLVGFSTLDQQAGSFPACQFRIVFRLSFAIICVFLIL